MLIRRRSRTRIVCEVALHRKLLFAPQTHQSPPVETKTPIKIPRPNMVRSPISARNLINPNMGPPPGPRYGLFMMGSPGSTFDTFGRVIACGGQLACVHRLTEDAGFNLRLDPASQRFGGACSKPITDDGLSHGAACSLGPDRGTHTVDGARRLWISGR